MAYAEGLPIKMVAHLELEVKVASIAVWSFPFVYYANGVAPEMSGRCEVDYIARRCSGVLSRWMHYWEMVEHADEDSNITKSDTPW